MKEEKFPHTRKPLQWLRRGWAVGAEALESWKRAQQQGCRGQSERFPHRGSVPTSTHQPKRIVCSLAGARRGWELRLGIRRSDPRERTGVGCMNTA